MATEPPAPTDRAGAAAAVRRVAISHHAGCACMYAPACNASACVQRTGGYGGCAPTPLHTRYTGVARGVHGGCTLGHVRTNRVYGRDGLP